MKRVALAFAALALSASPAARGAEGDGFIDDADACQGSGDFSSQDETFRAWGGALLLGPGLSQDKRDALRLAVGARRAASGAVWRLVEHPGALPVGLDGVLVASCPGSTGAFAFAYRSPSGALAVRWGSRPPADWAALLADELARAEGAGPLAAPGGAP